jgi:hypothetical protein
MADQLPAQPVGRAQASDAQPHFDATPQYVREQDSKATNAAQRYPPVE